MLHYLNNAGAGLMSPKTVSIIKDHLHREIEVGAYRAAQESKDDMAEFYSRAANLINAENPNEIAFTDSASRSWNMALHGVKLKSGDHIVTLSSEFGTNLVTLFDRAYQIGAFVHVIGCNENGDFDIVELDKALHNGARLVAISHAAAHGSIINPVKEIGHLTKQYGAVYIVDGCQAVGQIPVDVQEIHCDAYTATGRKWLRGPRGTGFLYVNPSSHLRSSQLDLAAADLVIDEKNNVTGIDVREDARQFELWERNVAIMLGLSSAMDECHDKFKNKTIEKIQEYAIKIREVVAENPNLKLFGKVHSASGVVGFYLNKPSVEKDIISLFEKENIGISTMSDWDCPLHFPKNGAKSIFRISPHYYTPDSSIDVVSQVLSKI